MSSLSRTLSDREPVVRLRPVDEADLPLVVRFYTDADVADAFQWFGFRPVSARDVERQWTEDGLINNSAGQLVVDVGGDYAGEVDGGLWERRALSRLGSACCPAIEATVSVPRRSDCSSSNCSRSRLCIAFKQEQKWVTSPSNLHLSMLVSVVKGRFGSSAGFDGCEEFPGWSSGVEE
jgi:hypothetical protein